LSNHWRTAALRRCRRPRADACRRLLVICTNHDAFDYDEMVAGAALLSAPQAEEPHGPIHLPPVVTPDRPRRGDGAAGSRRQEHPAPRASRSSPIRSKAPRRPRLRIAPCCPTREAARIALELGCGAACPSGVVVRGRYPICP
jgi:hypothetical protein